MTDRDVALSFAVVNAVSIASDTPVLKLPPLTEVVDPGAMDALFAGRETSGRVEFRYAGHPVTVHADGTIEVSRKG